MTEDNQINRMANFIQLGYMGIKRFCTHHIGTCVCCMAYTHKGQISNEGKEKLQRE